jgi:FkbM family methyltransferase
MRKRTSRRPQPNTSSLPHKVTSFDLPDASVQPKDSIEWKILGLKHLQADQVIEARTAFIAAVELAPDDVEARNFLGRLAAKNGEEQLAYDSFKQAVELDASNQEANVGLGEILFHRHQLNEALARFEKVLELEPDHYIARQRKVHILTKQHKYEAAATLCEELIAQGGNTRYASLNELGTIRRNLGQLELARECYRQAAKQTSTDPAPLSNLITISHYLPDCSPAEILKLSRLWGRKFAQRTRRTERPIPIDLSPTRRLKVGMISDGFRQHPVGAMITTPLEQLVKFGFDLYFYSSNAAVDCITLRLQNIASQWTIISTSSDAALAQRIRDDGIDILIDLAGHNSGSRMRTVALEPAPLIIKWVGGLINTTGVESIDYLITDGIESPPNSDDMYTEKLIRMPDDYICYMPPAQIPNVDSLPAIRNGYITFGCFNNPTKLNSALIEQWARLLCAVPNSRLYLKGGPFGSAELRQNVAATLASHGIDADRICMEGHSKHYQLFECYNNVDIALDPWPYSGGLTTCEAMLMGVPVVTLPGPTFAGRHSATHLINAGMPELVANSWDEYISRAAELASDIDSLSKIRKHLRQILLASPVCNAEKYGRHLADALRAIWTRYCNGQPAAALAFNTDGQPWFEDENVPTNVTHPNNESQHEFNFAFKGKILAMDHGASFAQSSIFATLKRLEALTLVILDPAGHLEQPAARHYREIAKHYYPYTVLGDGKPTTLYVRLNASLSGTLNRQQLLSSTESQNNDAMVLTELSIPSIRLDDVDGLTHLDWLLLDDTNDNSRILKNGSRILSNGSLVQVNFSNSSADNHENAFTEFEMILEKYNYKLLKQNKISPALEEASIDAGIASAPSRATYVNATFIPNDVLLNEMDDNQRWKLAFLLHTVCRRPEEVFNVLEKIHVDHANRYREKTELFEKGEFIHSTSTTSEVINVVDIGANPIDGTPPYKALLDKGMIRLIGFEPQQDALQELNRRKGPHERYLPHAIGRGGQATLYICRASGMTSTLRPNFSVLQHFQGYPIWAEILREERISTIKLDDIEAIDEIDWLKIDIQGGELAVFENGRSKLRNTIVIQTEVNFIPLYENQPLFAEIDQWMRNHGFMLHTFLEERRRLFAPYILNGQIHQGINQLTTADAVYIRDINSLEKLTTGQRQKLSTILREAYGSLDLAQKIESMSQQKFE